MNTAKITFKGQVTIPKEVREALDIKEGDSIVFTVEKDHAVLKPIKKKSLGEFLGAFPAKRPFPGAESIRAEVRQKLAKHILGKEKK